MNPSMPGPWQTWAGNLLLALACGLSARAAQTVFGTVNERIILFWPPVGIALAAVLLGGPRLLWGAFLGTAFNGIWYGLKPGLALAIAGGDMLEVLVAYWLLSRDAAFDRAFSQGRDYLYLFAVCALATAVGTSLSVGSVILAGHVPLEALARVWPRWWMGDQLGILLLTPAVLIWWLKPWGWLPRGRRLEFLLFMAMAFLFGQVLFGGWAPPPLAPYVKGYLAFLYVTWAAVRYGRHGVTAVLLLILAQALAGAAYGVGYFASDAAQTHLSNFWFFMVTLTVVGVTLASVIQERERAERSARSEASFKDQVLAGVPGGLLVFGPDGRIVFANARAEAMLGLPAAQLKGRASDDAAWQLVQEDLSPLPLEAHPVQRVLASGHPLWNQVVGVQLPGSAAPVWMLANAFPEVLPDGTLGQVVVMLVDITDRKAQEQERRHLESLVQHAQKMESLGTLAGGVAHDMNNVLGGIMMVASTLREIRADDPELRGPLDTLLSASERGRNLIKKLLEFARQDMDHPQPVDLNEIISKELDILRHTTRQKVEVVANLAPDLPRILGEPSSLATALMNLSVNALDAMEGGGTLTLETRALPDGQVEVVVADTGCGMSPEVLGRAFDPFFTTKPVGKGTGLGLSLLHATLTTHGATVNIQSEPGQGTRFTLVFPPLPQGHAEEARTAPAGGPARAFPGIREGALALVVDDEALIREVTPPLLQTLGLRTETLALGAECLARLQRQPSPDLIILDHNMPGLTGTETLRRLRARGHQVPVIMASGFLDQEQETELRKTPRVWILKKPYALGDLKPLIAEILGSVPRA